MTASHRASRSPGPSSCWPDELQAGSPHTGSSPALLGQQLSRGPAQRGMMPPPHPKRRRANSNPVSGTCMFDENPAGLACVPAATPPPTDLSGGPVPRSNNSSGPGITAPTRSARVARRQPTTIGPEFDLTDRTLALDQQQSASVAGSSTRIGHFRRRPRCPEGKDKSVTRADALRPVSETPLLYCRGQDRLCAAHHSRRTAVSPAERRSCLSFV